MNDLVHIYCVLQGIILVYDITDEKSFNNIKNWIQSVKEVHAIHIFKLPYSGKLSLV